MQPVRIQLSCRKGFDLQEHSRAINGLEAVNVARPGKWGTPFNFRKADFCWLALSYGCRGDRDGRQEASVKAFREWIAPDDGKRTKSMTRRVMFGSKHEAFQVGAKIEAGTAPSLDEICSSLRGNNLACWCKLDDPCHAEILLELANR